MGPDVCREPGHSRRVLIHIPHEGNMFPAELIETVLVRVPELVRYHEKMRDTDVHLLVPEEYRRRIVGCGVSRLFCDVERFTGPEEVMEKYGMGWYYTRAFDGTVIRDRDERAEKAARVYYDAHHAALDRAAKSCGRLLLMDMHSFSGEIVPKDFLEDGRPLPDICIGADERYTDGRLVFEAVRRFSDEGYSVEVNYPYSGTMVPNAVLNGEAECDLQSVMIEVNKRVYLGGDGRADPEKAERIRKIVGRIIRCARPVGDEFGRW